MVKFKTIAHRAKIIGLLENSMSAISECVRQNVQGIEFDVRHTSDGTAVVYHDKGFDRLARSNSNLVRQTSEGPKPYSLSDLDINDLKNNVVLTNGEKIPTLVEVLDLLKKQNQYAFVEFKDFPKAKTLELLCNAFYGDKERLRIISFDHKLLKKLKKEEFFKDVRMLALHEVPKTTWLPGPVFEIEGVNSNLFNPAYALYLKSRGLEVGMWWLPDKLPPKLIKSLFGFVDFITTDHYTNYR